MSLPILAGFLLLPLLEIALFVVVGGWIGLWPTLGLVLLSTALGVALVRGKGFAALRDVQRAAQGQGDPMRPLAHGAMAVVAGFLLILPGFFTDMLGVLLLLPPVRDLILRSLAARVTVVRPAGMASGWPGGPMPRARGDVIDGEATEIPPDAPALPRSGPSGWTRPPE